MNKIIRNILAISLSGILFISGCSNKDITPPEKMVIIENDDNFTGNTGEVTLESGDTYAVISIRDYGDIKIKLFPEGAPYAVKNFISLAESGYFNGKNIHRVMSDFMLQGGSLNGDGTGGDDSNGGSFRNEINTKMRHYYGALCYASAMGSNTCQFYIVNSKLPVEDVSLQYDVYLDYYNSMAEQYKEIQKNYDQNSQEYEIIKTYIDYYNESVEGLQAIYDSTDDNVNSKYLSGGVPFLDGCYTVFGQTVEGFDVIDKVSAAEVTSNAAGEVSQPVEEIIIEKVSIMTA